MPDLFDYETGAYIRPATDEEYKESTEAATRDGGAGVILAEVRPYGLVERRRCFTRESFDESDPLNVLAQELFAYRATLRVGRTEDRRGFEAEIMCGCYPNMNKIYGRDPEKPGRAVLAAFHSWRKER